MSTVLACPACEQAKSHTVETRGDREGTYIRRTRVCDHCGHRWRTIERSIGDDQPDGPTLERWRTAHVLLTAMMDGAARKDVKGLRAMAADILARTAGQGRQGG